MTLVVSSPVAWDLACRPLLQFVVASGVRVALPVVLGLLTLRALHRNPVEERRMVANASLASAWGVLVLSLIALAMPRAFPTLYRLNGFAPMSPSPVAIQTTSTGIAAVPGHVSLPEIPSGTASDAFGRLTPLERPRLAAKSSVSIEPGRTIPTLSVPRGSQPASSLPVVVLTVGWALGATGLGLRLLLSTVAVHRMVRRGSLVADPEMLAQVQVQCASKRVRVPNVVSCDVVQSPFVTGLRSTTLVLPTDYRTNFEPEALQAIVAHEVMHLAQRDCSWALLSRLLSALFWPLPIVWSLSRYRETLSEEACDIEVMRSGCSATAYARCLVELAERIQPLRPERMAGVGALTARSGLAHRIERILSGVRHPEPALSRRRRLAVVVAAVVVTVPCTLVVGQAARRQEVRPTDPARAGQAPAEVELRAAQSRMAEQQRQIVDAQRALAAAEKARQDAHRVERANSPRMQRAQDRVHEAQLRVAARVQQMTRSEAVLREIRRRDQEVAVATAQREATKWEAAKQERDYLTALLAQQTQLAAGRQVLEQAERSLGEARQRYVETSEPVRTAEASLDKARTAVKMSQYRLELLEQQAKAVQHLHEGQNGDSQQPQDEALMLALRARLEAQKKQMDDAQKAYADAEAAQLAKSEYAEGSAPATEVQERVLAAQRRVDAEAQAMSDLLLRLRDQERSAAGLGATSDATGLPHRKQAVPVSPAATAAPPEVRVVWNDDHVGDPVKYYAVFRLERSPGGYIVFGIGTHRVLIGGITDPTSRLSALHVGDRLLSIDGTPVTRWTDAIPHRFKQRRVVLTVVRKGEEKPRTITLNPAG